MTCHAALDTASAAPMMAHDPDLGTWNDQTQSAFCRRCRQRVPTSEWVEGPCAPKEPS
jgi:hypothetical protein